MTDWREIYNSIKLTLEETEEALFEGKKKKWFLQRAKDNGMICEQCQKWRPVERNGLCASCNAEIRKAERKKAPSVPDPIAKVSQKQSKMLNQYAKIRQKFLLNKWCAYHGKPCLPTEIHHAMGRVGFADDQEIPLLVDIRYFVPVCREAHMWIEEHPKEAKEQGYSESRLSDTI